MIRVELLEFESNVMLGACHRMMEWKYRKDLNTEELELVAKWQRIYDVVKKHGLSQPVYSYNSVDELEQLREKGIF